MEIQWPLILFTFFNCLAGGIFLMQGILTLSGKGKAMQLASCVSAIVALAVGGLASVTHLSHPERMLEALNHPTSGIFVEAVLVGVTAVLALAFAAMRRRGSSETATRVVAVAAAAFGVALSFMAGASYMMEAHANWNTVLLPLGYLGTVIPAGIALYLLIASLAKAGDELGPFPVLLAAGGVVAAVLAAADTAVSGGPDALVLGWVLAVAVGGIVPAAAGFALKRKPAQVTALAGVAALCALAGAVAFRADMWTAAQFICNYFSPL